MSGTSASRNLKEVISTNASSDQLVAIKHKMDRVLEEVYRQDEYYAARFETLEQALMDNILTTQQAAGYLGMNISGVRKALNENRLEGWKEGSVWRTTLEYVVNFIRRKKKNKDIQLSDVLKMRAA